MITIQERLRDMAGKKYNHTWSTWVQQQCNTAADTIEQLERDLKSAQDALGELRTGMPATQEPKYTTGPLGIYSRASGEIIPVDEPVFIFRARDRRALVALNAYAYHLLSVDHRKSVAQRIADFAAFSAAHPGRMKEPDTAIQTPNTGESI